MRRTDRQRPELQLADTYALVNGGINFFTVVLGFMI